METRMDRGEMLFVLLRCALENCKCTELEEVDVEKIPSAFHLNAGFFCEWWFYVQTNCLQRLSALCRGRAVLSATFFKCCLCTGPQWLPMERRQP